MGIIEPSITKITLFAVKSIRQFSKQVVGCQSTFLYVQVKMVTLAARFVKRNLVNLEVFRLLTDGASCARQLQGEKFSHFQPFASRSDSRFALQELAARGEVLLRRAGDG